MVGALEALGATDVETIAAGAGKGDVVEDGSDNTGGALSGSCGVADGAVEGRACVALESFGGVEVESACAGAGAVVGVVD